MRRSSIALLPPRIVDSLAITAITGYQRYLSPYKGFRCAHRVLHRGESCSQYVKRMVREEGLGIALAKSRVRFAECKEANRILQARRTLARMSIESGENEQPENPDADRSPNPDSARRKPPVVSNSTSSSSSSNSSSCNSNDINNCGDCCLDPPDFSSCDMSSLDCNGCDSCGDCGDCGGGDCGGCGN
jgi:putative component of membrane protein insertase Oxa1/YidC/SpoIIIJ protein YidD